MNWSARFSWLMALRAERDGRATTAPRDNDDMADMGTAFGLDASFDAVAPYASYGHQRDASVPPSMASALESRLIRRSRL